MKNEMKITTPNDTSFVATRTFNAPRRLVWEAMTKPELIRRWLYEPPGWTMTACEEDQRVGGKFLWAWSNENGPAMSMFGVYREVTPPVRMVRTESFDMGCGGTMGEQLAKIEFEEVDGKTHVIITVQYDSKEARDGALASGMEKGMATGYDNLEELLKTLL